jgi:hypothetical protein
MSVAIEEQLSANPVDIPTARRPEAEGGARNEAGFYAWWLKDEWALPAVPTAPHPVRPDLRLLYVGIAPSDAMSAATIRTRVLHNHLGNPLGSSTLRRSLAALLWEIYEWSPCIHGDKLALPANECAALTRWMERELLVSWCEVTKPWEYEPTLIADMVPPLNSDHNHGHAFYGDLREARQYIMTVARAATP